MAITSRLFSFLETLLQRSGGYYLPLGILITQLLTNSFIAPAIILVQNNAELSPTDLGASVRFLLVFTSLNNLLVVGLTLWLSRHAFHRLELWRRGQSLAIYTTNQEQAWREIANLPRRYGVIGLTGAIFVVIVPLLGYQALALRLTADQIIYTLLGGAVAAPIIVLMAMILLDWIMQPVRQVLLPTSFETQAAHIRSVSLFWKLQLLILTLVSAGLATLAPVGYRMIVRVVEGMDPIQALRTYQVQSLGIAFLSLVIAATFTTLSAYLLNAPFTQLLNLFQRVEQGQLHLRANVFSSDEGGELEVYFNRMVDRLETLQASLEKQVADRTAQLAAVIEVGHAISAILDPDELMGKVVNLITDRFGHYYAAIFLLDSTGKWAELKHATGEAGRILRESRHRLAVDSKSMVGTAIRQKRARIALDVGLEPARFSNPLLPYTRSEIALPLMVGDRVLGALDVQSTREAAFQQEDIEIMQSMANQVAIAVENAQLFQELRQRLQELQRLQSQYVRDAWSELTSASSIEYGVGEEVGTDGETTVQIPLTLRNQQIGSIRVDGDQKWTEEERAWMESLATQVALALENARLMEESRKEAGMDRIVSEITARIWSAGSIEGILQTAAREIGRALNASEAIIALGVEERNQP